MIKIGRRSSEFSNQAPELCLYHFHLLRVHIGLEQKLITARSLSLPKKGLPEAVAAMLVNNQIFISSSMKKVHLKPSFRMTRQGNKMVNRLLSSVCKLCGNMEEHPDESTHFYGANCAEIMVLHQWANYGGGRTAELRKGKIVTIGRDYESSKETAVKIKAPCRPGSKNGYACGPLLIGLALRALDENTVIPATTRDLGLGTATQVTVLYPPNLVDRISLVEEMVCYHNILTY